MTQLRTVLLSSSLLLALCGGVAQAQSNTDHLVGERASGGCSAPISRFCTEIER